MFEILGMDRIHSIHEAHVTGIYNLFIKDYS